MENDSIQSLQSNFVPTPTFEYRIHRKIKGVTEMPGAPKIPPRGPRPFPILLGSRVLIYVQDPSVTDPTAQSSTTILIRKKFLPAFVSDGPRDLRIVSAGLPVVARNAFGDFIQTPGTDSFDAVQTFAVARMALTMAQRALKGLNILNPIPWQWNTGGNTEALSVFAHGLPDTMNAFYQRTGKCLKFGDFIRPGSNPPERIFTCRSLDIVAHETGHAILDSLKPNWLSAGNPPQTGGLHESFGDLTAIFLTLTQTDLAEAIIVQTKAHLHDKTFLADLAEEFGLALGRTNGLRNADNNLKLSEVGTEVHAISQVFTGAIYDILADIFAFERNESTTDDAKVLINCGQYLYGLLLRAIIAAPVSGAVFADIANQMLIISLADGKPVQYRNFIRGNFVVREVVVSSTPMTEDVMKGTTLKPKEHVSADKNAVQDRSTCCGTMKLEEYLDLSRYIDDELKAWAKTQKQSENGSKKLVAEN
jgi:hypothetical protein